MPKLDKKTAQIISNDERVARFVDSDDWKVVKQSLITKVVLNDSMSPLVTTAGSKDLLTEILARAHASALVLEWLQEVEGRAKGSKVDVTPLVEEPEAQIVTYFE